jgi:hypothetical protein
MIATCKRNFKEVQKDEAVAKYTSLFGVAVNTIEVSKEEIDVQLLQLFQMN